MLYAIIGVLVIIADQWVKWWVSAGGTGANGVVLIPGIMSMVKVHNDGAAFSFLAGGGARIYFIILTGVFTVLVIIALATKFIRGPVARWAIVLVTAGGISNCIDRVISGYVLDMFKFELPFLDWFPVFNVADVFITVFCLVFVLAIIFGKPRQEEEDYDLEDEFEDDYEEELPVRPTARERRAERRAARAAEDEEAALIEEPPVRSRRQTAPRYDEDLAAAPRQQRRQPDTTATDPFAEWDRVSAQHPTRRTGDTPAASRREAAPQQPVQRQSTQAPARPQPAQRQSAAAQPVRSAQPVQRQSAPAAQRPAEVKKAEPARKSSADTYSLDDILAEFSNK